jgi:sec-independent protein translocase protein TatB
MTLILIGLFIFGPERLPKAISDGLRMLRQLRDMARNASADLSREMGTTVQLEDLNPKTFLRKHLLSEEDERALRRPLESVYRDLRDASDTVAETASLDDVASKSRPATTAPKPGSFDLDAT